LTLKDLGITKKQSPDWQAWARMSNNEFKALTKERKTRVAVTMGVVEVNYPRRTAAKARRAPAPYPRVSRKFGEPLGREIEADEADNSDATDEADNSNTRTQTGSAGRLKHGSFQLSALPFNTFQAQLRSEAKRLLATIDNPPDDLLAHLRNCAVAITGLVDRGFTR
jgi:hypothetical protein